MWISSKKFNKVLHNIEVMEKKLDKVYDELYEDTKYEDTKTSKHSISGGFITLFNLNTEVPTVKSKVDAIIKHLGLEVNIKEATEKKVVAKVKKEKNK